MHTQSTTRTSQTIPATLTPATAGDSTDEVRRGLPALRGELYTRALRLTRCPSRADDVVQEAMVRALRFSSQFRSGTNLRAWVGQVLVSVFLTQCRRNKRERKALDNLLRDPCAWLKQDGPATFQTLSRRPASALAALPDTYRTAVQLVDLNEMSYREAAERLNVPVGTIMSRLHRGRKMLAAQLVDETTVVEASADSAEAPLAA
jgi:RNA polymerase sigma-70 factor (ECF subfamily)